MSRLGFGGAPAGLKNYLGTFDPDKPEDREPVIAAVRRAWELGVTYFDTAPGYGAGRGERIFGEALQGVPPESIFLSTKVGVSPTAKRGHVRRSLEASLRNLRRDHIDLLQIHGSIYRKNQESAICRPGGVLDEMDELREEGLVHWLGFTAEAVNDVLYRFIKCGRFDVMQVCYNFIFQHPYMPDRKCGCLIEAEAAGLGIATMRSTTSGIFQKWIRMVNPRNSFDYTPALIQFQLSNPLVDVALVGMRTVAEVEQNVALVDDTAGRIDLDELLRRYV